MESLYQISLVTLVAVVVRWSVSLNGYSGQGKAPMFGDYEAQRHWMEITYNLPINEWYKNGKDNNLTYWGLDYPPLTAYHSWICGAIAHKINPIWVELISSQGIETYHHKLFMRYTVLLVDLILFFPAVYLYFFLTNASHNRNKILCAATVLLYPGLILIDHGHFQYNCVSLGLALLAVVCLSVEYDILGSIAFVLALNYKQMELYHSLPFFCYLLGRCFRGKQFWLIKLILLGLSVIGTFAICWFPFLKDQETALQVLKRLFPFNRGLYEDKVANFWCSISVLIKVRNIFSADQLIKICLGTTVVTLLPSSLHLLIKPSMQRFKVALVNASLIFFLFSFQVHEKSILISALPVSLLLPYKPLPCLWFLIISTFSMLPLLIKDGLVIPFLATTVLFYLFTKYTYLHSEDKSSKSWGQILTDSLFSLSMIGAGCLTIASLTVKPPKKYPDIFPVLISIYSCGHYLLFLIYFHYYQFTCADDVASCLVTEQKKISSPSKEKKSPKSKHNKKKKAE